MHFSPRSNVTSMVTVSILWFMIVVQNKLSIHEQGQSRRTGEAVPQPAACLGDDPLLACVPWR